MAAGELRVEWQGAVQTTAVDKAETGAVFKLPAGQGLLDVRFQPVEPPELNSKLPQTAEDVLIERVGD